LKPMRSLLDQIEAGASKLRRLAGSFRALPSFHRCAIA
jgi:hypothetical protein